MAPGSEPGPEPGPEPAGDASVRTPGDAARRGGVARPRPESAGDGTLVWRCGEEEIYVCMLCGVCSVPRWYGDAETG